MKIIIVFILHVVYTHRGLAEEKTYPVLQGDIISSVQKRLKALEEGPDYGDEVDDQCLHRTNYSTIIKTNQSIADKAVFLKFHKGKEKADCVLICCETTGCNLAVYETKDNHNCYLFDCGTRDHYRCHFAHHDGYMAMTFQGGSHPIKSPSTQGQQDQHEDELEGLEGKGAAKPALVSTTTTTTTVPTTTTTTRKPTTTTPKSVALYGDCSEGGRCDDENAVCRGDLCICHSGYHAKYGKCRQDCHDYQLECENKGLLVRGPDCINLSLACDGTPQCADGSDENDCQPTGIWDQQHSSGRDGVRQGAKSMNPPEYNPYKSPESDDRHRAPNSDRGTVGHQVAGTSEDMSHPKDKSQSTGSQQLDKKPTGDEPRPSHQYSAPVRPKPHPQNTATPASQGRIHAQQTSTSPKTSVDKGRLPAATKPEKAVAGSGIEGNTDRGLANNPAHGQAFKDSFETEISQKYREHGRGGFLQPSNPQGDGTNRGSAVKQDFVHKTDGRPQLGQHSAQRPAVNGQGRQPSKPHRNRYNYPYNTQQKVPPGYQYPVQYPTYDLGEYGGDDFGPGYPDYSNSGPADGGGYDYNYRHPYMGQGGYDSRPYRPRPNYQHKPVNDKSHPVEDTKMKISDPEASGVKKNDKHSGGQFEESKGHPSEKQTTSSPPPTPAVTTGVTETTTTTSTTGITVSGAIIKQPSSKPNATNDNGWDISRETLHDAVTYFQDSAQGPIVALALGLAFTVILLVFVGCRLRTVKRRIRKGRALNSNEADYLINGMYL